MEHPSGRAVIVYYHIQPHQNFVGNACLRLGHDVVDALLKKRPCVAVSTDAGGDLLGPIVTWCRRVHRRGGRMLGACTPILPLSHL